MTQFAAIPKFLPPRNSIEYAQKIPKLIYQTLKTDQVPDYIKSYADSWIDLNPEYEYRFYDDNDIIKFIETNFPGYLGGYKNLKYGASKADLWRYLVIYQYGGVYADMDCKCITPLREWIKSDSPFVTQLGINKDICQWLIMSTPKNPVFIKAAQKTLENAERNNYSTSYYGFKYIDNKLEIREKSPLLQFNHPVLGLSGPPVLQQAAEECFRDGSIDDIWKSTQIVCQSGAISCQMNGHVVHDTQNSEYKKSMKKIKAIHYNSRLERLKRIIFSFFMLSKSK